MKSAVFFSFFWFYSICLSQETFSSPFDRRGESLCLYPSIYLEKFQQSIGQFWHDFSNELKRFYQMFTNCFRVTKMLAKTNSPLEKNWKSYNVHLDTKNAYLTTLPKFFSSKGRKLFAQSPRMIKLVFQKIIILLEMFLWTCRMQFWQTCRIFWVSFWKLGFFKKKTWFFQDWLGWAICYRISYQKYLFLENIFSTLTWIVSKNQKYLNTGKLNEEKRKKDFYLLSVFFTVHTVRMAIKNNSTVVLIMNPYMVITRESSFIEPTNGFRLIVEVIKWEPMK